MDKKKEEDKNYEIKFWKDWLESDPLKRLKLVETLPITKTIWNMEKLHSEIRNHSLALLLNGFFEDLESAIHTKNRLEKRLSSNFKHPSKESPTEQYQIRSWRKS